MGRKIIFLRWDAIHEVVKNRWDSIRVIVKYRRDTIRAPKLEQWYNYK